MQNVTEACQEKNIDFSRMEKELIKLTILPVNPSVNFKEWDLGFLMDYIINTHHKYVLKTLPELVFYTDKIATVHGTHHTELVEVASLFSEINAELGVHLKREEEVFFPMVREMISNPSDTAKVKLIEEIKGLRGEHDYAGGAVDNINQITKGYIVPEDGCNTYRVAFKLLEQFEDDLHVHVHLENNILFPKVKALLS